MAREFLVAELDEIIKRYRRSTAALELFVEYSFDGIAEHESKFSGVMDRVGKALRGEVIEKPGPDTVSVQSSDLKIVLGLATESFSYFALHPKMLLEMSLTYAGALYDAHISDALLSTLRHIPERLRSGRSLTVEEALRFRDRDELVAELARREVRDLMYKSASKQLDYFRTSFGIDIFADESMSVSIVELAAIRERRNLVAHNNGAASAEYISEFNANLSVGDSVITDQEGAKRDRNALSEVGISLISGLYEKFNA